MTKVEYIRQLEFSLTGKLSKREISEILRDYSEYFDEGKAEGKTEEEICIRLGIPSMTAAQILTENEEDLSNRKRRGEAEEDEEKSYFWESWPNALRSFFKRISAWIERTFSSNKTPDYGQDAPDSDSSEEAPAETHTQSPPPLDKKPHTAKVKREKKTRGNGWSWLGKTLLFLFALPFMLVAAVAGVALIFLVLMVVASLLLGLVSALLASLAAAFVSIMACAVLASAGVPVSFIILLVAFSIFFLAGSVLSCCLIGWLMRWTMSAVRRCFGREKSKNTSRNPAYHAQVVAQSPLEETWNSTPYTDGWQASAPPSSTEMDVIEPDEQTAPLYSEAAEEAAFSAEKTTSSAEETSSAVRNDSNKEKEAREDA